MLNNLDLYVCSLEESDICWKYVAIMYTCNTLYSTIDGDLYCLY